MKIRNIFTISCCSGLLLSCTATVPSELADAREAYQRASSGIAATVAPAEVHKAHEALQVAEKAFEKDADSYQTRDLAYVAQRKAQLAEATASIATDQKSQASARNEYDVVQGKIATKTRQDLAQTRSALAESKLSGAMTEGQLSTAQAAQLAAEQRAADALAKLAAVKVEPRGTVITLSGSVLFASGQADLLPAARTRLDQVAAVLLANPERKLIIEGHTDSQGANDYNFSLSQRRADAVRNYLMRRDYRGDRIQAEGLGEGHPIADNSSAEGRANNRRVEIVIERSTPLSNVQSSNP